MDLTLHQLEVFHRVALTRSFTQAAAELRVSQPVISRTIGEIERKAGIRLFTRTTRSVDITAGGREFLAIAAGVLGTYQVGLKRFSAYRAGEYGHVRIAALPSVAAVVLPPILAGFLAEHPGITLHLLDGTTREVLEHLRSGAADLAVADQSPASSGLTQYPLVEDLVVAVLPAGHRHAARAELSWSDLAAERFVAFSEDSSVRRLTDLGFAQAGVEPETLVETRTVATAGGMIAAGLGISAMPELVLPLLSFTRLVTRPLTDPVITRNLSVHLRPGEPLSAAAQRVADHIVSVSGPAAGDPPAPQVAGIRLPNAYLAGNSLPARCDVGRLGYELRLVL
jgi:LysR family transcriptional regulator, carnitine catabolism transcriptional activator